MKALQSYIFRAISAIVVGALLVKYREETVTWLTILIGVIFFVSGVISCIAYISARRTANGTEIFDAQGQRITPSMPSFPLVGIGSIILGGVLALSPDTFTSGLMYVLAIILILGALGQFFSLSSATRFAHIGLFWWVMPVITFITGLVALVKPALIATAPLFVIGWCLMVYGLVELVNAIKINQCRKSFEQSQANIAEAQEQKAEETSQPTAGPDVPELEPQNHEEETTEPSQEA